MKILVHELLTMNIVKQHHKQLAMVTVVLLSFGQITGRLQIEIFLLNVWMLVGHDYGAQMGSAFLTILNNILVPRRRWCEMVILKERLSFGKNSTQAYRNLYSVFSVLTRREIFSGQDRVFQYIAITLTVNTRQ